LSKVQFGALICTALCFISGEKRMNEPRPQSVMALLASSLLATAPTDSPRRRSTPGSPLPACFTQLTSLLLLSRNLLPLLTNYLSYHFSVLFPFSLSFHFVFSLIFLDFFFLLYFLVVLIFLLHVLLSIFSKLIIIPSPPLPHPCPFPPPPF
jgi:hypothetical protein